MSQRVKDAANSPYQAAESVTDIREFPETDGEILTAEKFIALADDAQALAERLAVVEATGGGPAAELGGFDIPYTKISVNSPSDNARTGRCEWVKDENGVVTARINIADVNSTSTAYIIIDPAFLLSEGLPAPAVMPTTRTLTSVIIPVNAVVMNGSTIRPVKYATWDAAGDFDGFEIALDAAASVGQVFAQFTYPTINS